MSKHRTTLIFKTVVDAGDSAAISRLLELIPDSAKLYPRIRSRFTETCYDPETRREFWIGGDDRHIICFMITGIGSDEVSKIRSVFQDAGRGSINLEDIVTHAAGVTGGAVHLMN